MLPGSGEWTTSNEAKAMNRRLALLAFAGGWLWSKSGKAFGESGAFSARFLEAGKKQNLGQRESAFGRWGFELIQRTSAPARLVPKAVAADRPELYAEPFVVWAGQSETGALAASELVGLERFLKLGGVLVVDDTDPAKGEFGRAARRELLRVLPASPPVKLDPNHVVFRTYYMLDRPVGRVLGPPTLDAIVRGRNAQVILLQHDLTGALARTEGGWAFPIESGSVEQREHALRLAVNIAMYVLCSDYKDDQVHAPWLMRRRGRSRQ
jgi:hypothetical protein